MMYVGRFLNGFATGTICVTAPTYMAEISEPSIRGMLGSCFQLLVTLGVLAVDIVGIWTPWRWIGAFCGILPVATIVAMLFVARESPTDSIIRYIKSQKQSNDRQEALETLTWLRGSSHDCQRELKEIEDSVQRAQSATFQLSDVKKPGFYKPLSISLGIMMFQQFCGINAVISYTAMIFTSAGSSMKGDVAAVIVMLVQASVHSYI
ncbi:unnamed protein product, partial [Notodromas monacha]